MFVDSTQFALIILLFESHSSWTRIKHICKLNQDSLPLPRKLMRITRQTQHMSPPHGFVFDMNKSRRDMPVVGPTPNMMKGNEMPEGLEVVDAPIGAWMTPGSQGLRPRPATIHEGFSYCAGEDYTTMPSWDASSNFSMPTPSDTMSRPVSMHQEFFPPTTMEKSKSTVSLMLSICADQIV